MRFDVMPPADICEYSGHLWLDAGGGMSICAQCQEETFDPVEHEVDLAAPVNGETNGN